ncbi:MAG: Pyridoxal-5'-phosphate-dependent protein beta subunit [Synergistales bacterium 53_16]|nr:MAG: Pyridoxal-5'-phosphate-dependent protein beta subunit [Synergistales bacterium 53_16]KUL00316.1 MAG: Pyridoxal-5'-phosphate-dependent protein beta subunit [Synergistales bacterium 54_9]MDK2846213.1 cysteine synthase [Synergistales bacterium]
MEPVKDSVLDVIGKTPMVRLDRLRKAWELEGTLLAKLENLNPGCSKKDRIALRMVEEAEASGQLEPGRPVVELTSGNTGTGLAIVCSVKGYPFYAVMSRGNSMERARMMRALGAEVILVDQAPGSPPGQVSGKDLELVEERTREIVRELGAFRADQFNLEGNVRAHEYGTGEEIWEQTEGRLDGFVDFAGTGGTFAGCSRALKKHNPDIRCYLLEPATAPWLGGGKVTKPNHRIQGGGYCRNLDFIDPSLVTEYLTVTDEEAMEGARALALHEGIFGGFSTGAHVFAAARLLRGKEKGNILAFLVCDSGLKYVSTDLYP